MILGLNGGIFLGVLFGVFLVLLAGVFFDVVAGVIFDVVLGLDGDFFVFLVTGVRTFLFFMGGGVGDAFFMVWTGVLGAGVFFLSSMAG